MKYQVGDRVTGTINNVTDLGIFLTLPGHRSGLIHRNDFLNDWAKERRRFEVGQALRVVVTNTFKGRLGLSLNKVNSLEYIDHHNPFTKVNKKDFDHVLNKTVEEAKKEIKKLKEQLNDK